MSSEVGSNGSQREVYSCVDSHTLGLPLEIAYFNFSPKNNSNYEWEMICNKRDDSDDVSLCLCPTFLYDPDNYKSTLFCSYTLSVENSTGKVLNQWKVENNWSSEREATVCHVVGHHDVTQNEELTVHIFMTFVLQPMGDLYNVPVNCIVRIMDNIGMESFSKSQKPKDQDFSAFWIVPHGQMDRTSKGKLMHENIFWKGGTSGYNLSLKTKKGVSSVIILSECVQPKDTSDSDTQMCRVRYTVDVRNSKGVAVAQWNVDSDCSPSFYLLQSFPLPDGASSVTHGDLKISITGSFNDVTSILKPCVFKIDCKELKDFASLLNDVALADVELEVDDSKGHHLVPAHRAVLAARSTVFRDMFTTDTAEKKATRIGIPQLDLKSVRNMLNYIYAGMFDDNMEMQDAKYLLVAAENFALKELKRACELKLMQHVKLSSALELFKVSEVCKATDLQNVILEFLTSSESNVNYINGKLRTGEGDLSPDQKCHLMTQIIMKRATKLLPD